MRYKDDWEAAKTRMTAWWNGEPAARPAMKVFAPRKGAEPARPFTEFSVIYNRDEPGKAIEEYEAFCRGTYFGGEAFPDLWINFGPGIMASFLGVEPEIKEDTVWFEDPREWDELKEGLAFDADNPWWRKVKDVTRAIAGAAPGRFFSGITDLGGILDVMASFRSAQTLLMDLVDCPDNVKRLSESFTELWWRYFDELSNIHEEYLDGASSWMGIWCPGRWYPLQCDFAAMISPDMFAEFVVPSLTEHCRKLDYSIYHLDGPGELPHLDHLLAIEELGGIQWVPGAGVEGVGSPKWYPIYKRIQEKGKLLCLTHRMQPDEIERLLGELSPKGLLVAAACETEDEAQALLTKAETWAKG